MVSLNFEHYGHEVFSGSFLGKGDEWKAIKAQLPAQSYLLVGHRNNPEQMRQMLTALKGTLENKPVSVIVLL